MIFVKNLSSRSAEELCRGTLLCCVSEISAKKFMDMGGPRGENQDFPSKIFCLTVPKHFADEPFCAVL